MNRPNCYECKHRGIIVGSAHSSCNHPSFGNQDPTDKVMAIFASVGRVAPVQGKGDGTIRVKGNALGIKNGWFQHPFNFDPVWLDECNGFERKEKNE